MRGRTILRTLLSYLALVFALILTFGVAAGQSTGESPSKTKTVLEPNESAENVVAPTKVAKEGQADQRVEEDPVKTSASEAAKAQPVGLTESQLPAQCRKIKADVVALPQPIMLNRLGAAVPDGLVFALKGDTSTANPGMLREGKRPRPLVLRANVGDCLTISLTNLIPANEFSANTLLPGAKTGTTEISLHVQGMEWVNGAKDDGSFVGQNAPSLATVTGASKTQEYTLFAKQEGSFLLYTHGDTSTEGKQLARGLFGALNVQPANAEWYRSQVSANDLLLATFNANRPDQVPPGSLVCTPAGSSKCKFTIGGKTVDVIKTPDFGVGPGATKGGYLNTPDNHPLIDYNAVYPAQRLDGTAIAPELVGKPILKMLDANNNLVHSDLTAMITGPQAGRFPGINGNPNKQDPPCNAEKNPALGLGPVNPLFCQNPAAPDRKQPYREITVIYHGALFAVAAQAFPVFNDSADNIKQTLIAGQDAFAINYGTGGIGAEVYANRIGVGPMGDCVDCKFEEFFLSAWSVGDPAMLVDKPANSKQKIDQPFQPPCNTTASFNSPPCGGTRTPASGTPYTMTPNMKAKAAFFPDDPSNVYHSYINDHVKFRILHGGWDVSHVHHQHAHQWLQSPNSDEGAYLDSQMISPGASYTLEMVYNGSGNRNKVVGDSIFHCHFYPHFAAGMWAMWRTHDTFEAGTFVYPKNTEINGKPVDNQVVPGSRALPDGEIITGVPTPAIVPLPTLPMAPLPAYAQIQNNVPVAGSPNPIKFGGQTVIGGTCKAGQINGLDVIGGCVDGQELNGTVINSQYDFARIKMVGQFQPSPNSGKTLLNPGFPYFIPGIAGARAPHPPFDFACTQKDINGKCLPNSYLDGGLPRHNITGGSISLERHSSTDWSKDAATLNAVQLPEDGTPVEKVAMSFHGKRCYPTFFPDGTPGSCPSSISTSPQSTLITPPTPTGFLLNGLPRGPQQGAPYADPAVDDNGKAVGGKPRIYKAAAFQLNVVLNKKGWHFPQQRMLSLWKDVGDTLAYKPGGPGRQPEPLFFRGNTGDIIEYWHTNLVPHYFEQDAFQVRTPTDILGQHIHLVKFDVTSSDGAGNGFNYEDGTFAPDEVQDLIKAINAGSWTPCAGCPPLRAAQPPPADICNVPNPPSQCATEWKGAQTTIQRWYLDPLVDNSGVDRTLRTVFTHDHFGPSTHQQAGLYAGLLVEPMKSTWTSNNGLETFGTRSDGGPTSWQARILTANPADSYREFMLEFQDLQLAYDQNNQAIGNPGPPPSLITTGIPTVPAGTQSVNYTNEPIPFRLGDQNVFTPPSKESDLSYAFDNTIQNTVNPINLQGNPENPDPFTPLMRAYQNDKVQIRILVGAHVFAHQFSFFGPTWFSEPSWQDSGYRTTQAMGLSEHFEFLFNVPPSSAPTTNRKCPDGWSQGNCVDYLYSPSFDENGLVHGLWGLFRSYDPTKVAKGVKPLPNNPITAAAPVSYATCPGPPNRKYRITAVSSQDAVPGGSIVFNDRGPAPHPLSIKTGVMYVFSDDLDLAGKLKPGVPIEPLILRANAGDCVQIELTNKISNAANSNFYNTNFELPPPFNKRNPANQLIYAHKASRFVGLLPQLLSYDAATSSGMNIGWNSQMKDQVIPFQGTTTYTWYAGKITRESNGKLKHWPVEFGALNLFPSDPMFQNPNGLFGAMIIEPAGSKWQCGEVGSLKDCVPPGPAPSTRASATITPPGDPKGFREFVPLISDALNIPETPGFPAGAPATANNSAINYRTEPWKTRYAGNATTDFSCMLSNNLMWGNPAVRIGEPKTPIFTAGVGDKVRFRLAHPFGTGTSQVFTVHGHMWQRNPYTKKSQVIGNNNLSQWLGSRDNHGSSDHADLVIDKAGGEAGKAGDYLYSVFVPIQAREGPWGVFRVGNAPAYNPTAAGLPPACKQVPQPGYYPPTPPDQLERFVRKPLQAPKP